MVGYNDNYYNNVLDVEPHSLLNSFEAFSSNAGCTKRKGENRVYPVICQNLSTKTRATYNQLFIFFSSRANFVNKI